MITQVALHEKLCEVISNVTKQSFELYPVDFEFSSLRGWDSLNKVKFIVEVERFYKIRFNGSEVNEISTIVHLCDLIHHKLATLGTK